MTPSRPPPEPTTMSAMMRERGYVACRCGAQLKRHVGAWACTRKECDDLDPQHKCGKTSAGGATEARPGPNGKVVGSTPTRQTTSHPATLSPGRAAKIGSWSNATATVCEAGHRHPSKMEARVCARLTAETKDAAPFLGAVLFRQVRLPLLTLAPKAGGTALYATVDFAVVIAGKLARLIDAKSPTRISREWRRGAAALESAYGIKVEEVAS